MAAAHFLYSLGGTGKQQHHKSFSKNSISVGDAFVRVRYSSPSVEHEHRRVGYKSTVARICKRNVIDVNGFRHGIDYIKAIDKVED